MEIVNSVEFGIFEIDKNYNTLYMNDYIKSNFLSKDNKFDVNKFYKNIYMDYREEEYLLFLDFMNKLNGSESICKIRYSDDTLRWVKIKRNIMSGKYFHTITNIDDVKKMESDLTEAKIRSESAYNHKSLFLANMSHEIRTPLNGIVGMITLLQDTEMNSDQKAYIDMLNECSTNLMSIINDILDYSKLEAGKIVLENKCFNLRECVDSINDILSPKIYEKSLIYNNLYDDDVPEYIDGDMTRLKQILLNILNNSVKFTEKGNIELNVSLIKSNNTNNNTNNNNTNDTSIYIKFTVRDTGCGIEENDIPKLFKSFSQLENFKEQKINQGTGLGLAISKELVSLMSGDIWVDYSKIDIGTVFCFTIKTSLCGKSTLNDKNEEFKNGSVLNNKKVLILDDKLENRLHLVSMVQKWGLIPTSFSSAREALYILKTQTFDIGLIDICMPEMDGRTFSIELQNQNNILNKKQIPLIALSSLGDSIKDYNNLFKEHLINPVKELRLKKICNDILTKTKYNESNNIKEITIENDNNIKLNDTLQITSEFKDAIRILLVEDVLINQRVVFSFLNKIGFDTIDIADNGKMCLEMMVKKKYDIVLLDIRMPILNGETVFKYIDNYYKTFEGNYKLLSNTKPYVVAVTAYSLKEDREKYLTMGFNDYIPKPINYRQLNDCMNNFLHIILKS